MRLDGLADRGVEGKERHTSAHARRQAGTIEAHFPAHFSSKVSSSASAASAVVRGSRPASLSAFGQSTAQA